jgi:hypothetical protein
MNRKLTEHPSEPERSHAIAEFLEGVDSQLGLLLDDGQGVDEGQPMVELARVLFGNGGDCRTYRCVASGTHRISTMTLSAMSLMLIVADVTTVPSGTTATRISEAQIPPLMRAYIFAAVASPCSRAEAPPTERSLRS